MKAEGNISVGIEAAPTDNRMNTAKDIPQNAAIAHEAAAVRKTAIEAAHEGGVIKYSEKRGPLMRLLLYKLLPTCWGLTWK